MAEEQRKQPKKTKPKALPNGSPLPNERLVCPTIPIGILSPPLRTKGDVNMARRLDFLTESLPSFTVGVPQKFSIEVDGGTTPYTFQITSGSLPSGLSLSRDGTISGTVEAEMPNTTIFVTVTDAAVPPATLTQAFDVQVIPAPQRQAAQARASKKSQANKKRR